MTAREFVYWLQGFFEITSPNGEAVGDLDAKRVAMIQKHLALVFKHEIDPSYPNREELDKVHAGAYAGSIMIDEVELKKALTKTAEELRAELTKAIQQHESKRPHNSHPSTGGLIRC